MSNVGDRDSHRENATRLFVLGVLAVTVYLLYWVFQPFLSAIAWAIFLTTAFYPMHTRIVRAVRGRGTLAAVLSTLIVASVIVLPIGFIITKIASTVSSVIVELDFPGFAATAPGSGGMAASDGSGSPAQTSPSAPIMREPRSSGAGAPTGERSLSAHETNRDETAVPGGSVPGSPETSAVPGAPALPNVDASPPGTGTPALSAAQAAAKKRRLAIVADIESFLSRYVDVHALDLEGTALAALKRIGQVLAVLASNLVQNILWTVVLFAIMIFTMIYLFREGPGLLEACQKVLPLSETDRRAVFSRLHDTTRAVFYGVFMTSAIQGLLGGIGWWVVGLPSALTAGAAMFLCSLLPTGTVLVWGPGAIYLLIQGHPIKAVVLTVWGLAIVGTIDNVLRPYFISGRTQMHSLLVFFGVLGGLTAFGIGGLFIGPLVITLFLFLVEVIQRDLFPGPADAGPSALAD